MKMPEPWQHLPERCCARCKYLGDLWPFSSLEEAVKSDADAEMHVFQCSWGSVHPIPYSWRYATREVMGVSPNEGADCATFAVPDEPPPEGGSQ